MAFPSRTPMGVPPVQPAMMPQGYAFTPMGMNMMHMGMRMMPPASMMARPMNMGVPVTTPAVTKPQQSSLTPPGITIKDDSKGEKYPTTTVFVGNISDKAPDTMVRTMLQRCGNVLSWKRVIGASGKLQAFGFCEYDHPESTLRCIRLLNEWAIADKKKLVVKVDAKTKTLLDEYKAKKNKTDDEAKEKGDGDKNSPNAENGVIDVDALDEDTQREDRVAKAGLDAIMREYAAELNKVIIDDTETTPPPEKVRDDKKYQNRKDKEIQNIDELELDTDKKDLINREIRTFRDQHKGEEPQSMDKHRDREKGGEEVRRRERMERVERQREREHQRQRERDMRMERDRERIERERERSPSSLRSRTPVREKRDWDRSPSRERIIRRRSHERDSREKSHTHSSNRERREREREQEIEEEEEAHERRRLEKQMREKEAAYRDRLKAWESRENKKIREYKKERDRESDRKAEEAKEARRLKEFLEDYDDIRDDAKYYKGSALSRRLKEREKEQEADERDRQREKEEHEEIRMRLMEEGHLDIEAEMARLEQQREEHLLPPDPIPVDSPSPPPVEQEEPDPELAEAPDERMRIMEEPMDDDDDDDDDDDEPVQIPYLQPPTRSKPLYSEQQQPSYREHSSYAEEAPSYQEQLSYPERPSYPEVQADTAPKLVEDSPAPENDTPNQSPPPSGDEDSHVSNTAVFGPAPRSATAETTTTTGFGPLKIVAADSPAEDSPQTKDNGIAKRRKPLTVGEVFNQDDEEESGVKKRKLVPLDYEEEKLEKKPTTIEEKRASIKKLIERIPTAKDELFAYKLDWTMVDKVLMDKRIKPWVDKKIIEYIGEEEPTLTEFICQKVMAQSTPQAILNDVAMVLDEEAEVFIVKMWRLLIYETEAKRAGLVK